MLCEKHFTLVIFIDKMILKKKKIFCRDSMEIKKSKNYKICKYFCNLIVNWIIFHLEFYYFICCSFKANTLIFATAFKTCRAYTPILFNQLTFKTCRAYTPIFFNQLDLGEMSLIIFSSNIFSVI